MAAGIADWGLGTVERRSTSDRLLPELRAAILSGRALPREPLPEVMLAQAFATARSAIRETRRQPTLEGLVVSEMDRGASGRPIEPDIVIDACGAATDPAVVQSLLTTDRGSDAVTVILQLILQGAERCAGLLAGVTARGSDLATNHNSQRRSR